MSMRVYGRPRPKHHHRMHISEQAQRLGVMVDTEAGEAKHQAYKNTLADRLQTLRQHAQLQSSLLGRMLQEQMDNMASQRTFCAGLIPHGTNAPARAARTQEMFTVAEGDVLLQLPLTNAGFAAEVTRCTSAGGVLSFVVELLQKATWQFYGNQYTSGCRLLALANVTAFIYTLLAQVSASLTCRRTRQNAVWTEGQVDNCARPTWWLEEADNILCLL